MNYKSLNKNQFDTLKVWAETSNQIPTEIRPLLKSLIAVYSALLFGKSRAKYVLAELRKAMGLIPKSEKGSQLSFNIEENNNELTAEEVKRLNLLVTKRELAIKQKKEYEALIKSIRGFKVNHEQMEFDLKDGHEAMFSYPTSQRTETKTGLKVDKKINFSRTKGLSSTFDYTKRMDLNIVVTEIEYKIETVTDPLTGNTVRASTIDHGPKGFQITWGAITNLLKLHVGFAIPINRISLLIGQPEFSSSKICRILKYMAEQLLPMYLYLAEQLSDSKHLWGDDTSTKILNIVDENEKTSLSQEIEKHLPFTYPKAVGEGNKQSINVSLLIGKPEGDFRSTIRFYRSHQGSVGNLLTQILEWREAKSGPLFFQGDLSNTNKPSPEMMEKFDMTIAGCGAHARRPFWKHKEEDPSLCYFLLRAFACLAKLEKRIDFFGRTETRVLYYRRRFGMAIWRTIEARCEGAITGEKRGQYIYEKEESPEIWPKGTELNRACQYIIKHFNELTLYLEHPQLKYTNNISERALRIEKSMLDSSKFRKTKEGRAILDILRTINATCTAAQIDLKDYIPFLMVNNEAYLKNPKNFTPFKASTNLNSKNN